jgi:hypothetical protein
VAKSMGNHGKSWEIMGNHSKFILQWPVRIW